MASEGEATSAPPTELRRQLGLGSATALVVAEVIGVGIFLTPAGMARSLGSPFGLLMVWLAMGVVTLAGALCFGSLAARLPEAGGGYAYLREAFGPRWGFLYGWMCMLVLDPGLTAILATGMARYAGYIVALSPIASKTVAIGTILILALVNMAGVRLGARVMRGLAWLKLGLLTFLALWGFGGRFGEWSHFVPFVPQRPGSDPLPKAIIGASIAAFFSFGGWWDMSKVAGEVRDPARTMPRAMTFGVGLVTVAYVLISSVFLYLVPLSRVTTDDGFAALAGEALFGRAGGVTFSVIVVASVLGSLASIIMACPRVYYAMARDGLFLPGVANLHPRFGTPTRAIALQAALAFLLVAVGSFEQILAYFFFTAVVFLVLMVSCVFVLRPKTGEVATPRLPGYPITPLIFLVPTSVILVLLAVENPRQSFLGMAVVAIGLPVYQIAFRRAKPKVVSIDRAEP